MATYGYIAVDKAGKESKGSIEADSEEAVRLGLKHQGLLTVSIKEQNALNKDISLGFGKKVSARDLSIFCRQFVSMTRAGVTILEALRLLKDQTENKKLAKAIKEIQAGVEKGETLSGSLDLFQDIFPKLMITTIAAGESSGSLDVAFERMAIHFEKAAKTKALVKKAMIYPCVIAIVAVAVVILMLAFVIPNYTDMFKDMDMELPAITQAVVAASDFILKFWFLLIPLLVAVVVGIRYFTKTDIGQLTVSKLALKIPIFKNLTVKSASSQLARTLSTLLAAGVPLVEAVEITGRTMDNALFKAALVDAKADIVRGLPLSTPLEQCGLFPPMVYHMIRIGEEAGSTEDMLDKLADYYDEEVETATQSLMAAMEPAIIIVMAAIVGLLIAAVMAPMMSMYTGLDAL
ncbi:MAG: type II secretion system F family protein [Lachnospiraceae bacterium]